MVSKRDTQNNRTQQQAEGRRPWSWTPKQFDKLNTVKVQVAELVEGLLDE